MQNVGEWGGLREAFSGRTLDAPNPERDWTNEIIAASRRKYCKPRQEVEEMLKKWDETATAPPSKEERLAVEESFEEPII